MSSCWRPSSLLHKLTTLLVVVFAVLAKLMTATPLAPNPNNLSSRSQPGVYICAAELFTPPCQHYFPPLAPAREDGLILGPDLSCSPLPYQSSQVLSFGPDHDVTCIVFRTETCDAAGHEEYTWPGTDYLPGPGNVDLETGATGTGFKAYGCRGSVDLT